jgi:hypothetical protein
LLLDVDEYCKPIHLALLELSDVEVAVGVSESSFTIFLPVPELTPVLSSVCPLHLTLTIDLAVSKLALVGLLTLLEIVGANAFK